MLRFDAVFGCCFPYANFGSAPRKDQKRKLKTETTPVTLLKTNSQRLCKSVKIPTGNIHLLFSAIFCSLSFRARQGINQPGLQPGRNHTDPRDFFCGGLWKWSRLFKTSQPKKKKKKKNIPTASTSSTHCWRTVPWARVCGFSSAKTD